MSFRQLLRSCVGVSRGDLSARRASSRRISRWEAYDEPEGELN